MSNYSSGLDLVLNDAIAKALFVSAWADAEARVGRTYPETNLLDVAPPTPDRAKLAAAQLTGRIEERIGMPLCAIYAQACKADGISYAKVIEACRRGAPADAEETMHVNDFGFCVGMMGLGSGVNWFDSHERFMISDGLKERAFDVPNIEFYIEGPEEALSLVPPSTRRPQPIAPQPPALEPHR